MKRKIVILNSKDGNITLKVNNVLIHSKYNPAREGDAFAKKNIDCIKNKKVILLYGFGLGYHVAAILKHMNPESKIFIFDADKEVVSIAKKQKVSIEILKDKRVKTFFNYNSEFMKKFSDIMPKVNDIIIYKPSLKVLPEEFADLKRLLTGYELAKIEIAKHGKLAEFNYNLNIKSRCKKMKDFYDENDFQNKNIIIVSSGPSLNCVLEDLKKFREKIVIFCAGSAAELLTKNGIIPDMICIIDPQDIVYFQLKDLIHKEISLCFLALACSKVVSEWDGEKYIFFNSQKEADDNSDYLIETGKSVATAILSIAILAKPKKVIFVGQDLAYVGGKSHHNGYGDADGSGLKKVESVTGEKIETNEGFLYFKKWIENKISKTEGINFINCSKGANIAGTIVNDLKNEVN